MKCGQQCKYYLEAWMGLTASMFIPSLHFQKKGGKIHQKNVHAVWNLRIRFWVVDQNQMYFAARKTDLLTS